MSAWDFKFVFFSVWTWGERAQARLCQRHWCTLVALVCARPLFDLFSANDKPFWPISLGLASGNVRYNLCSALSRLVGWEVRS